VGGAGRPRVRRGVAVSDSGSDPADATEPAQQDAAATFPGSQKGRGGAAGGAWLRGVRRADDGEAPAMR
jgi:hypothetical protein